MLVDVTITILAGEREAERLEVSCESKMASELIKRFFDERDPNQYTLTAWDVKCPPFDGGKDV